VNFYSDLDIIHSQRQVVAHSLFQQQNGENQILVYYRRKYRLFRGYKTTETHQLMNTLYIPTSKSHGRVVDFEWHMKHRNRHIRGRKSMA